MQSSIHPVVSRFTVELQIWLVAAINGFTDEVWTYAHANTVQIRISEKR